MAKGMTKTALVKAMAEKMELTNKQTSAFLELLAETAVKETKKNGEFTIPGIGKLVKAERKARLAEIRQLIEQSRLPKGDSGEHYNFVDGNKIRRIAVDASLRERLHRGEIAIARYDAGYEWVPAATAARIRERDERAIVAQGSAADSAHGDDAYQAFGVPDDLMW